MQFLDLIKIQRIVVKTNFADPADKRRLKYIAANQNTFDKMIGWNIFQTAHNDTVDECGGCFVHGIVGNAIVPPDVWLKL